MSYSFDSTPLADYPAFWAPCTEAFEFLITDYSFKIEIADVRYNSLVICYRKDNREVEIKSEFGGMPETLLQIYRGDKVTKCLALFHVASITPDEYDEIVYAGIRAEPVTIATEEGVETMRLLLERQAAFLKEHGKDFLSGSS